MSEAVVQESPRVMARDRGWLGVVGVVVAFVGLGLAVLTPWIIETMQPPRKELAGVIADAGGKLVDKVKGVKPAPPPEQAAIPWVFVCSASATCLGLIGAIAGTAGWIRREDRRLAATAIIAGGVAAAWTYVVIAFVIALVLFFLLMFLDLGPG